MSCKRDFNVDRTVIGLRSVRGWGEGVDLTLTRSVNKALSGKLTSESDLVALCFKGYFKNKTQFPCRSKSQCIVNGDGHFDTNGYKPASPHPVERWIETGQGFQESFLLKRCYCWRNFSHLAQSLSHSHQSLDPEEWSQVCAAEATKWRQLIADALGPAWNEKK